MDEQYVAVVVTSKESSAYNDSPILEPYCQNCARRGIFTNNKNDILGFIQNDTKRPYIYCKTCLATTVAHDQIVKATTTGGGSDKPKPNHG